MIKKFCDACNKEVDRLLPVSIPCHLWQFRANPGYVDSEFNSVSGRDNVVELCRKCHNRVMDKCVVEILKIASENGLVDLNKRG